MLVMVDDDMQMSALTETSTLKTIITLEGKLDLERKGQQSDQGDVYARLLAFGNGSLQSLYDHTDAFYLPRRLLGAGGDSLRGVRPPLERPRQAIPTMEEMRSFLTAAMEEPLVYRVYFFMDLMTAARRGELCALTWADITEYTITISKSRSYVKGMGLVTGTTKNGRARVLSNCELLVSLLNEGLSESKELKAGLKHGQRQQFPGR